MKNIFLLFLFITITASAQTKIATTHDGRKVILKPDHTWEYVESSSTSGKATEALNNILNESNHADEQKGRTHNNGSGTGSGIGGMRDYQLTGRRALVKIKPEGCNELGKVVIEVTVDSSGNVILVQTGRGTTGSPCLIDKAKAAAIKWKFEAGTMQMQTGNIVFNFSIAD